MPALTPDRAEQITLRATSINAVGLALAGTLVGGYGLWPARSGR